MDLRVLEIKDFIKVTDKEEFLSNIQYKYYFKIKKKVIFFNDKIFKILNDNNIQVHLKGNFIKDVENLDKYFDKIMNFKGYNEDIYRCRKKETDFFYLQIIIKLRSMDMNCMLKSSSSFLILRIV